MVRAGQRRQISQVAHTAERQKRAGRDQQVMSVVLNQAAFQGSAADGIVVQPGAIVTATHHNGVAFTHERQGNGPSARLAVRLTVLRGLDAMVNGIAQ